MTLYMSKLGAQDRRIYLKGVVINMFSLFPLGKMCGAAFEKNPTKSPLCQVWLKLGKWFWRRRF